MNQAKTLAKKIKLFIFDIDGVCTDGKLYFSADGEALKVFHVHDGLGIRLLQRAGIEVAIITARQSAAVTQRMQALGVTHIYQGSENKVTAYEDLLKKLNLTDADVAYMGDDLPDLKLIKRANFGVSVANGSEWVKQHADWITTKAGGHGAVREACEFMLTAQNKLEKLLEDY